VDVRVRASSSYSSTGSVMSTRRRTLGVFASPTPKGPNGERLCRNCHGPMPADKRKHNCSPKCVEEWRCKTSPSHLRWVLFQRDHGVCAKCGVDTDAQKKEYRARINAIHKSEHAYRWQNNHEIAKEYGIPPGRVTSDWWDADHIVPVIEGGGECGPEGYQTLCIPCHKKETAELRKRMAARAKAAKPQRQMSLI